MPNWTADDIPDQSGKFAIVTGTGGLGYETALELARHGAEIVLAGRNPVKGAQSLAKIRALVPAAKIAFEELDLADLASVRAFAQRMNDRGTPLDLLVNNAGVMAFPTRRTTVDGFETQFGTNHLGHFALTAQLLPLLRTAAHPRVVTISSGLHHVGEIRFDDLQSEKRYTPNGAYSQSKLANLLFALELQRRSDTRGWGLLADAAHPGASSTDLIPNGPGTGGVQGWINRRLEPLIFQSPAAGALPTLLAATAPFAKPGGYYGPQGFLGFNGPPGLAGMSKRAKDKAVAARLWDVSEKLTGVSFPRTLSQAGEEGCSPRHASLAPPSVYRFRQK
jgi:NAD(P)-dependent dehydrogenase (short-subunit alcohol dehydrogenase family)